MSRIKIIIVAIVALLTLIVVLENTQWVETKILFFIKIGMPLAALLFVTALVGFVLGFFVAGKVLWKKRDGKKV